MLREDEEFRREVESILGISTINSSLKQLSDNVNRLVEAVDKLSISVKELTEAQKRTEGFGSH